MKSSLATQGTLFDPLEEIRVGFDQADFKVCFGSPTGGKNEAWICPLKWCSVGFGRIQVEIALEADGRRN